MFIIRVVVKCNFPVGQYGPRLEFSCNEGFESKGLACLHASYDFNFKNYSLLFLWCKNLPSLNIKLNFFTVRLVYFFLKLVVNS